PKSKIGNPKSHLPRSPNAEGNTMAARLERLPLCGFHRRFIGLVSLGSWFDIFDIFMMAYLGAALQDSHFLTLEQFSHLIAAGFMGMFIGAAGALFVWYLRRALPESPRWAESRGRRAEAERIMRAIEDRVGRETQRPLPEPKPLAVRVAERMPFRELWQPVYRGRTAMLVVFHLLQTIGIYGFANWAPTFLLKEGKSLRQSLAYGFLMALVSPVGPLIGVLTTER